MRVEGKRPYDENGRHMKEIHHVSRNYKLPLTLHTILTTKRSKPGGTKRRNKSSQDEGIKKQMQMICTSFLGHCLRQNEKGLEALV